MKATFRCLIVVTSLMAPVSAFAQLPNQAANANTSISLACVSPQRVFAESPDGKAAIARMSALQSEKARAIDDKNKDLQAQEQALQQSSSLLSDDARNQRSNAIEKFRIDVQRFIQDAQTELTGVQRDLETAFLAKLQPAIQKVAKDRGFQLVFNLDADQILWADPSLDITPDVVKQLAAQ
jgi:Skp family chaperone for outer membrane proteins